MLSIQAIARVSVLLTGCSVAAAATAQIIQHVLINSLESAYTLKPLTLGIKVVVHLGEPRP